MDHNESGLHRFVKELGMTHELFDLEPRVLMRGRNVVPGVLYQAGLTHEQLTGVFDSVLNPTSPTRLEHATRRLFYSGSRAARVTREALHPKKYPPSPDAPPVIQAGYNLRGWRIFSRYYGIGTSKDYTKKAAAASEGCSATWLDHFIQKLRGVMMSHFYTLSEAGYTLWPIPTPKPIVKRSRPLPTSTHRSVLKETIYQRCLERLCASEDELPGAREPQQLYDLDHPSRTTQQPL